VKSSLDEKLVSKYPMLFKDRHGNMMKTAMCWGFECGDGWYDLLDKLCQCITEHAISHGLDVTATQVKEKYGTLRFYVGSADDAIYDMIDKAEILSAYTCEVCGKPGEMGGTGWYSVRCDEHA